MHGLSRNIVIAAFVFPAVFSVASHAALIRPLPPNAQALIVTPGDPAGSVVASPSPYDAVARVVVTMPGGAFGCSGSLLAGGQYLLTAAHCVSDGSDGGNPTVLSLTATLNDGQVLDGATYYVPPGWTGDFNDGSDLALVRLAASAVGITGYDLWRGADPWDAVIDVVGYGERGLGSTGSVDGSFGTLRAGQNELAPITWAMAGDPYAWDFDNGLAANDTLCLLYAACGTGLGADEVMIAPGDSGGPSFYLGSLLGVHSFGATYGIGEGDIDNQLNSSFGELAGDTRVNEYAGWIDSIIIPEPGSMLLLASGLAALLYRARRRC
jgi:hypothetical protein